MENYTYFNKLSYNMFSILERFNTHICKNYSFSKNKQTKLHLLFENIDKTKTITLMNAKAYSLFKYLNYTISYNNICNSYDNEFLESLFNSTYYDDYEEYDEFLEYLEYIKYTINIISYFTEKYYEFETNYKMNKSLNVELLEILIAFDIIDNTDINEDNVICPQDLLENSIINNYLLCKMNDTIIYINSLDKLKIIETNYIKYSKKFKEFVYSEEFMKIFFNINDVIFESYNNRFIDLIDNNNDNINDNDNNSIELNYDDYDYDSSNEDINDLNSDDDIDDEL